MILPNYYLKLQRQFLPWALLALLITLPALSGCSSGNDTVPPDVISLPTGFRPEGIATAEGRIFVGSIPTGRVFHADIATGLGAVLVDPPAGRSAIGLKVDGQGRIFVAGATNANGITATPDGATLIIIQSNTGKLFTVDPASGATKEI